MVRLEQSINDLVIQALVVKRHPHFARERAERAAVKLDHLPHLLLVTAPMCHITAVDAIGQPADARLGRQAPPLGQPGRHARPARGYISAPQNLPENGSAQEIPGNGLPTGGVREHACLHQDISARGLPRQSIQGRA